MKKATSDFVLISQENDLIRERMHQLELEVSTTKEVSQENSYKRLYEKEKMMSAEVVEMHKRKAGALEYMLKDF